MVASQQKIIAYLVTEDWYFCSHRLPLAIAAKEAGFEVHVLTRVTAHGDLIRRAGLNLTPVEFLRRGMNPFKEFLLVARLFRIYRRIRPDIVHHVALKPVLYGSFAARAAKVPAVVNAMAGLGYLFSSSSLKTRIFRPFVKRLFSFLFNAPNSRLILQNPDDVETFVNGGVARREAIRLILGSGVDIEEYSRQPEPNGEITVLLASRLLWDKGVGEYVEAARVLQSQGDGVIFILAGESDEQNPGAIPVEQLSAWNEAGDIRWVGRCGNMPELFGKVNIVCLPTYYGEGVPKVLIEAASCGRPIITTDAPGCREIVQDGVNGILVPPRDVDALVKAIQTLLNSEKKRRRMGEAGRALVKEKFSLQLVIDETLSLYRSMIR